MSQEYERAPIQAGCLVTGIASVTLLVLGLAILGFVLVLPLWVQLIALATSAPGAVMLIRSPLHARRTGDAGYAVRRCVYGAGLLALSLLLWAIVATYVAR